MTRALVVYHALLWAGLYMMLVSGGEWVTFIAYNAVLPFGALVIWFAYRHRLPAFSANIYPRAAAHALVAIALAAAIPAAIFGLLLAFNWVTHIRHDTNIYGVITAILIPQLFVATAEEFAFRGVTQPALTARYGPRIGLLTTALLFGLFHIPNVLYQDVPPALIPLTIAMLALMGAVFGQAYRHAGQRLVLPVALHYGWNIASFSVEDLLQYDAVGPRWLAGSPAWFPESGLLGTLGLALLGFAVIRLFPAGSEYRHRTPVTSSH